MSVITLGRNRILFTCLNPIGVNISHRFYDGKFIKFTNTSNFINLFTIFRTSQLRKVYYPPEG